MTAAERDPLDYVRMACEVHLGASPNSDAVDVYLGKVPCVFVWVADNGEGGTTVRVGDALPERFLAAVAFLGGGTVEEDATGETKSADGDTDDEDIAPKAPTQQRLQCLTLQPSNADLASDDAAGASSQATLLQALQMYTRHCFLPAVQKQQQQQQQQQTSSTVDSTTMLQDKIRELDVAIGQSQRSARLPHVQLPLDPAVQQAVAKMGPGEDTSNPDLSALGLSDLSDSALNSLQSGVSDWITQIRKLTVLPTTTPFPLIAEDTNADLEEIAFWGQLQTELQNVQAQLGSPGVQLTLAVLREAKRFVATLALQNNTNMEKAITHTTDVDNLLKGYPVASYQAARDFEKITLTTNAVFDHITKIRASRHYSLERGAQLLEATTLTLRKTMTSVLEESHSNFLFMEYKEYEMKVRFPTQDVFVQFDDRWEQLQEAFAEIGRRRKSKSAKSILEKVTLHHKVLADRLDQIHEFRSSHERLREVVTQVLQNDGAEQEAIQTVELAPRQIFSALNILDLSPGGQKALENATEEYDLQIDAMEERLARLLRDKLTACEDAEDMFRVFARFNPLLTRTRVRVAVKEFQMQLIATVAQAVEKLQSKFTLKYESSSAARISRLRGIPPIAGKILWAKQMERQVNALMERMSNVLGPNWGQHLEGRQLRKSGDELLAKLDPRSFFRGWVTEWERTIASESSSRMYSYPVAIETDRANRLIARVNFSEKSELLFKEVRHLRWLGFERDVPRSLILASDEATSRYSFAVAIKTALRSYQALRVLITPELEPLVMPQLLDVREIVSEAFDVKLDSSTAIAKKRRVKWDSREISEWVTKLAEAVTKLEERVEQLLSVCGKVNAALISLETVGYDVAKFQGVLEIVQKAIDEVSLGGYSDLATWVRVIDDRLAEILSNRLTKALKSWYQTFKYPEYNEDGEEILPTEKLETVSIPTISCEILLRNQEISAVPAVPSVMTLFLNKLHDFIGVVCNLPRPKSGRFEVFDNAASSGESNATAETFERLIHMVPASVVNQAYETVQDRVSEVSEFVDQWLAYQTLWDTQVSDVAASVGTDIDQWQALLLESAEARSALDSAATVEEFGPVAVKYNKVQSQINLKYDSWQKELQSSYASILAQCISELHQKITDSKTKLENATLESSSGTENIVLGVTFIQEMKQKKDIWSDEIAKLEESERLLKRQRHHFRSDWMETSVAKGQYDHLLQVLEKRTNTMEQQFPLLQARVTAEEKAATKRTAELLSQWEEDKPLRGKMLPSEAMQLLAKFEFNMRKASTHQENLIKAKDALGLEHTAEGNAITECIDELTGLKEVWEAIMKPYDELQDIKETPWSNVVMRKIRRALDDLLAEMRSLPNRIRQYDAYNHIHDEVKSYISGHGLLSELKTEALKDRHWKTILERLGIKRPFSELTIGNLWEQGVLTRKKEIGDILTVAQGEMALEVFLSMVRDRWMKQELELVLFQNRVRLIRGFDVIFETLDEHMGGLALMKSSPYYRAVREFQEEGKLWEERLTKLRAAFDSWVDVQRRWIYLESILLGGSSEIKSQLPAEWSRFKSVDSEFITLMRRIANRPYAMEVLNIENLQRTLERLANLMGVIQRALGEYLEKQRRDFSRFYFLGDDDLLEIMGNAGEPGKVLGHVAKMFAGIASARHNTDDMPDDMITRLDAMISKDGEIVPFHKPIEIMQGMNVKEWLKQLEERMKNTLAMLLEQAVEEDSPAIASQGDEGKKIFVEWATKFPAQVMILATQINWSMGVDSALQQDDSAAALSKQLEGLEWKLEVMAETVLLDLPPESRKKFEQMITELVHQRDVIRDLISDGINSETDFRWLYHLRYMYNPKAAKITEKLMISLSNATFFYGFEYLGIGERLVQTPLTDKCYLTLTQALHFRMGGSPFGPAGTGKTETVKALGAQLGRFVLVFNCDEQFDYSAMGRIFAGLSQVGAWGCFDEFNRLEERILSAVSQQILTIQRGLLERKSHIDLLGRSVKLHENVATFITMNPGYAGRSNLPDNLKSLFRSIAMVVPDRKLIAQVMLYSQGIVTAERLAPKVVDLFLLCEAQMSKQRHYDFGLRALKTLLVSAGALKRRAIEGQGMLEGDELAEAEKRALIVGACNNVLPKLVADDMEIFVNVLEEVFPGSEVSKMDDDKLRAEILKNCEDRGFVPEESFIQKLLQLNQVIATRHGVMVVGPVGAGKSAALKVLQESMEKVDNVKGDTYVIDPKAIDKERLYGVLDGTTLEWTDGVFTGLLRKILDNQKGESERRHWIIFDGDVDPEWAENLNSVLDDNKMLTLPSGERLSIPDNMRIILEVDSLNHATPATVSRCGMVWFSQETVTSEMCLQHMMNSLAKEDMVGDRGREDESPAAQMHFLEAIRPLVISGQASSLVMDALHFSLEETHVMVPTRDRLLHTLRALLVQGIGLAVTYDENHPDFPMTGEHMEKFARRWLLHSLMWSFCGSASWTVRKKFGDVLLRTSGIMLPDEAHSLVDYRVRVENGEYELWSDSVPRMEIESHRVSSADVVITTTDTVRHSDILGAWLGSRTPLILCGPPGSGKTMTLTSVLQSIQGVVLTSLNFSSRTTPEIILKVFQQYCNYVRRGKNIVLEPAESLGSDSYLCVFCDEINLPEEDSYGTQRVIMFMRQLVEQGGFWRDDNTWIKINRIQFVGACNPPTDAGRVEMSHRFLRHVPLLLVDFPERDSLMQIYGTFNGGMMKLFPNLKGETDAMTEAMVEVYTENQSKFTPQIQPQYFYSPRELSRWVRGIYEAIVNMDQGVTREELTRIWAHEGLRLFSDRLISEDDRDWCSDKIDEVAQKWFAGVDFDTALKRPLFYTSWLSKDTRHVGREELKEFLSARLRVFYEEELDVPLVIFDEVLEHILRIDRVLRQPMGHLLLVGDSGAGKTVLSRFVSWMNGLSVFQIKAHSRYDMEDFGNDLRTVMRRVGVEGEKICFIFDESNILSSGFLEAMNALLASGEVPGLFEGDEYNSLMSACRDSAARDGVILDSEEELWRRFTGIVQRNLHVVFTVNPSGGDWKNRSTTSPALFNRCVVDWFGTWGSKAMGEVGKEFTLRLDMGDAESIGGSWGIGDGEAIMNRVSAAFEGAASGGLRQAVVAALVDLHLTAKDTANSVALESSSITRTFLSPRDYLTLIQNFVSCLNKRREEVEDQQLHVNAGLEKLRQTQDNVAELKQSLGAKKVVLSEKESLANDKLQQMVADQNAAEKRKVEAEKMSAEAQAQQVEIDKRKEEAQRDLDEAEPALRSAQASVRGIKKRDLDEVRNLARPPANVKLTLECVAILLGETKLEWTDVRKLLSKSDFIPNILNFDADKLSGKQINLVRSKYIDGNPDLNSESVMRSSKACGPLYKWAESQIKYSTVYNRIQPLREEVQQLENDAKDVKARKEMVEAEVKTLESSIAKYKADYATLIRDVEALKAEMTSVETKVDRAESLLKSLDHESQRWEKSSTGFQQILRSLVGDGLLMAAFLTYSGFFDFKTRLAMMTRWKNSLDVLGIEYRDDLGIVESLSKASARLSWQSNGLPGDQLSIENGVILDMAVRYPLVIDPSGDAISFLMEHNKAGKIQKTSFLDKAFMKTLAGAVRFGTTLLVENVEQIDPVLNPLLNRELQRTGGRTLVRIGTDEVDFSPKFKIILTTKNPAVELTPDVCSRVTLVNFTVTPASLQSQSMSQVVRSEKPELETQRAALLKLQGEQNVKLRELEDQMLAKISACEGSILDDDQVVSGMEVLMKEGAQVEEQIAQSEGVMQQVHLAVSRFEPFAVMCRELFVLLGALREISFLYEFSAATFMSILEDVLDSTEKNGDEDEATRIEKLKSVLFREVAARIARGLQSNDKIVFSLLLARLFKSDGTIGSNAASSSEDLIKEIQVLGGDFPWQGRGLSDLAVVTEQELGPDVPLLLCSAPGHDVSGRVEAMAREMNKDLAAVAMGSSEGFDTAESLVTAASKRGTWVMLKNCHLCTDWLREVLVKRLQTFGAGTHKDFRMFITSEINPKLPTALLRICDIIVAEAPSGIQASMIRFFSSISKSRFDSPVRNRLYLLLSWSHAVVQEKLRYVPSGWSEKYEFTEADATHALDVIDSLIKDMGGNLDPDKLPWDAIRSTLRKGVFGGRVTQPVDQKVLDDLVNHLFVEESFNLNFTLVPGVDDSPVLPESTSRDDCFKWIHDGLASHTPPTWVGLNADAEQELEARRAQSIVEKVAMVSSKGE